MLRVWGLAQSGGEGKRGRRGFRGGNGLSRERLGYCHIFQGRIVYKGAMMDPMFDIPKDRKQVSLGKICLMIGLTALLFLAVSQEFVATHSAM
jgi:hypothetical protein